MYKSIAILFLAATVVLAKPSGGDLDAIMEDIYGHTGTDHISSSTYFERETLTDVAGVEDSNGTGPPTTEGAEQCVNSVGLEGRCVPNYLCETPVEDTTSSIDNASGYGVCSNNLEVCCVQ